MYDNLANATLRVVCGPSTGSGFHLGTSDIVVTNAHVIEPHLKHKVAVNGIAEDGATWPLQLMAFSPKEVNDFAILRCDGGVPPTRTFLHADESDPTNRGEEVLFSGFPHGVHDLLIHNAIISGKINATQFYVDGTVNGGNSGGPIIRMADSSVVGIVTRRRFFGETDLDALSNQAGQLIQHCQTIAGRGGVAIMGVDFGAFANLMSQSLQLVAEVLKLNANTGIGIGFHIRHVVAECKKLGIPT